MNDVSDLKSSAAEPVAAPRGALPDAPLAMPAQCLEAGPRPFFSWLSPRQTARGA